jgi:hypothetical protein
MKLKLQEFLNANFIKFIKRGVVIILLAAAVIPFQNCNPPDDDPPVVTDTTKTKVEPINYFKFNGAEIYNLQWDSTQMTATYKKSNNMTTIYLSGYSKDKSTKDEKVDMIISFPGKTTGNFKYSIDPNVNFEITITRNGIDSKYEFDNQKPTNDMGVNITKYDAVNGRVKGTFYGNLIYNITTATISAGAFEVTRTDDE